MNPNQLLTHIIKPVLRHLDMYSESAAELVLGTALQESQGRYIRQLGKGPAIGIYQMEPATHDDIWENYLVYQPMLARKVAKLELPQFACGATEMAGNFYYATAMCRLHYRRVSAALPMAGNLEGQAQYWKTHYNTHLGHGTVSQYIANWARLRNVR